MPGIKKGRINMANKLEPDLTKFIQQIEKMKEQLTNIVDEAEANTISGTHIAYTYTITWDHIQILNQIIGNGD